MNFRLLRPLADQPPLRLPQLGQIEAEIHAGFHIVTQLRRDEADAGLRRLVQGARELLKYKKYGDDNCEDDDNRHAQPKLGSQAEGKRWNVGLDRKSTNLNSRH